jgi:hypothetical protein
MKKHELILYLFEVLACYTNNESIEIEIHILFKKENELFIFYEINLNLLLFDWNPIHSFLNFPLIPYKKSEDQSAWKAIQVF